MSLAENLLTVIAKNQFTKDPYEAEMLLDTLHAVMRFYNYKDDRLMDFTIDVIRQNLSQNALSLLLVAENYDGDIINHLEPKELHKLKLEVIVRGKVEQDENKKTMLRDLYKLVTELLESKTRQTD